jgi:hypothetical protein
MAIGILGLFAGIMVGLRYKVLALLPATLLIGLPVLIGYGFVAAVVALAALQVGYFGGVLLPGLMNR